MLSLCLSGTNYSRVSRSMKTNCGKMKIEIIEYRFAVASLFNKSQLSSEKE